MKRKFTLLCMAVVFTSTQLFALTAPEAKARQEKRIQESFNAAQEQIKINQAKFKSKQKKYFEIPNLTDIKPIKLSTPVLRAASLVYAPQSHTVMRADGTGRRITYTYNSQGLIATETSEYFNGSIWANEGQEAYTYDAVGNVLTHLYKMWENGGWFSSDRTTYTYQNNLCTGAKSEYNDGGQWNIYIQNEYTYNAHGDELTASHMSYPTDGFGSTAGSKSIYTYDANNRQLTAIYQSWNNSVWANGSKTIYEYTGNSTNKSSATYQYWDTGNWINGSKDIYTYDSNNNILTETSQNWTSNTWVNDSREMNTYDANGNQLTYLVEFWTGTTWQGNYEEINTYNPNNDLLTKMFRTLGNNTLENQYQITNNYNNNNKQTSVVYEIWNGTDWDVVLTITNIWEGNNLTSTTMMQDYFEFTYGSLNNYTYDANGNAISGTYKITTDNGSSWMDNDGNMTYYYNQGKDSDVFNGKNFTISYTQVLAGLNTPNSSNQSMQIIAANNQLTIKGEITGKQIAVYNIAGVQVGNLQATSDEATIKLPATGVYVVRVGNETIKVMNK